MSGQFHLLIAQESRVKPGLQTPSGELDPDQHGFLSHVAELGVPDPFDLGGPKRSAASRLATSAHQ